MKPCYIQNVAGLWGLVNNAGIPGALGPAEWLQRKDYEKVSRYIAITAVLFKAQSRGVKEHLSTPIPLSSVMLK